MRFPVIGAFSLDRVKLTLLVALLALFGIPLLPWPTIVPWAVVVVSAALGLWAAIRRAWVDATIGGIVAVTFLASHLFFGEPDPAGIWAPVTPEAAPITVTLRTASTLALAFLTFTLLIGPWAHFTKLVQRFYKHRRHFGVTTLLLALLHEGLVSAYYFEYSVKALFTFDNFVFFGFTGIFILTWMGLTSWDEVQKRVTNTWWGVIHTGLLLVYLGFVFYFWQVSFVVLPWQWVVIAVFIVFWMLVAPWGLPRAILNRVNGWKQLHVLVYIAYAAIIVHAWTGIVQFTPLWVRGIFWAGVGAVVGSHAVGWLLMLRQFVAGRRRKAGGSIVVDGKTYLPLDRADQFKPGVGRRFDVDGRPIAAYLYEGMYFAMSAICPHQGGPIDQGTIVGNYLECPWHRYQFSVDDGSGPPEQKDCIPYYPCLVKDGMVYMSQADLGNCRQVGGHWLKATAAAAEQKD
jgi:nitrite reductase/ring-hydroxylating ferredoxin subunit/DMSO/TMAO reductase YedYZ heme-binding membrane subunit